MIKIFFTDFWPGWFNDVPGGDNFITHCVLDDVEFEITPNNPDIVFYTVFGNENKRFTNSKRVFWTGENVRPNFNECDLAITFDYSDNPKHVRLPLYAIHWWEALNMRKTLVHKKPADLLLKPKNISKKPEGFCSFVYGNGNENVNHWGNFQDGVIKRNELFKLLSSYKKIDSAGTWLNNVGYRVDYMTKLNFIKNYKFTFAIENSSYPGYVTEKIIDPMMVSSIPIYWGNSRFTEEFNEDALVNAHKFNSNRELADYIIYLDENQIAYDEMYSKPFISESTLPKIFDLKKVLKNKILDLVK